MLTGTVQSTSDVHAGPGVRRLARELGVNLTLWCRQRSKQRILKEDVQAFVKSTVNTIAKRRHAALSLPPYLRLIFPNLGRLKCKHFHALKKFPAKICSAIG